MARKAKGTAKVGLMLRVEQDREYFHLKLHPVLLDTEKPGSIRNPRGYDFAPATERAAVYLQGFEIGSQGNKARYDGTPDQDPKLYGFEYTFAPHRVDRTMAKHISATFATVDRKMAKFSEQRGYAASFGEFVSRVAEAIGATEVLELTRDGGHLYGDSDYRRYDMASARIRMTQLEAEYVEEVRGKQPKPVQVVLHEAAS